MTYEDYCKIEGLETTPAEKKSIRSRPARCGA